MTRQIVRAVSGALVWLFVVAAAVAQQPPAQTCSVAGDVVDESGQPVKNATLLLFPTDEQRWPTGRESKSIQWAALDAGVFKLSGFMPGDYKLAVTAEKVGETGPDAPLITSLSRRGFPLSVSAGEQAQVRLVVNADLLLVRAQRSSMQRVMAGAGGSSTLPAGSGSGGRMSAPPGIPPGPRGPGAMSGTVTDAYGRPVVGAVVQRFISIPRNGVMQFAQTGPSTTTDEHGVFHFTGLAVGDYFVGALAQSVDLSAPGAPSVNRMPPPTIGPDGHKVGYVTTYYPGTDTQAWANKVSVGATEVTAIDFSLQRQSMADVTGAIDGFTSAPFGELAVLVPAAQANSSAGTDARRAPLDRDGRFRFADVPLGSYVLNFTNPRGWAHEPVTVSATMTPLAISLRPPLTVKGRVEFLGDMPTPAGASLAPFRIRLTPATPVPGSRMFEVPISASGEFTVPGVNPDRYILQSVTTPPWTEMAGKLGGEDTLDTPVEVSASRDDAAVVLVDREAGVSGTVREEGGAHDALIVVYSADRRYWTSATRRVRISRIVAGSGFSVAGLPPGQYLAIALPLTTAGPAVNNALLDAYQTRALRFDLMVREHRTIEIQMIR